jgi:hypothetical protein
MTTTNIIAIAAALGTVLSAATAVWVYYRNSRLERAKWSLSLYEKFYESADLKAVRDVLDNDADHETVSELVIRCSSDFTDYLNFFEFMAFLENEGHLKRVEVQALFEYYISCLKRHPRVLKFIEDNGYENLHRMLSTWK